MRMRILCKGRLGREHKFVIADAVEVELRVRKRILCKTRGQICGPMLKHENIQAN